MSDYGRAPTRQDTDVIGPRVGAQIIDLLVVGFTPFLVLILFSMIGAAAGGSESAVATMVTSVGLLVSTFFLVGYSFLLEYFWNGQTIGKRLLGIRAVQINGEQLDFGAALIRNIPGIVSFSWAAYLVALLSMAASDKRQRLFDRIADTVVVREDHGQAPQQDQAQSNNTQPEQQTQQRNQGQNQQRNTQVQQQ